jgi:ATP phosphoribosyltransferase regulatory subunit
MGIRADITPQVARIDAHLLNREGVTRLCYCGSVLHALPAGLMASREPIQIGAELYGNAGLEADGEILRMLARTLTIAGAPASRIDLGHVAVFRALTVGMAVDAEQEIFAALQSKDVSSLRELLVGVPDPARSALLALPECYGGPEALATAERHLPNLPDIASSLADLRRVAGDLGDMPVPVGFDLADLRGYHYHSGIVFAAYCDGAPAPVALGGRYDGVSRSFGRDRPATGFSMDLREIAKLCPSART